MNYPRLVYKSPGHEGAGKLTYSTLAVAGDDELAAALADGWHGSLSEALAPPAPTPAPAPEPIDETSGPTRAELEQMATELGIKFDGRTADKTLLAKINEALK